MRHRVPIRMLGAALLCVCVLAAGAQGTESPVPKAEVTAHLAPHTEATSLARTGAGRGTGNSRPAVVWLKALSGNTPHAVAPGTFTLLQKNKMFLPHLLVVPVGSSVSFPNADPFFHNVFSLFDGRRFDLGLYEAGSTRSVVFSREGVSYIFCNIHSEMSAVVISLATPFYAVADRQGAFHLKEVPQGEYELHVWIEGQRQSSLDRLTKRVLIAGDAVNLGEMHADDAAPTELHLDKFGRPYPPENHKIY